MLKSDGTTPKRVVIIRRKPQVQVQERKNVFIPEIKDVCALLNRDDFQEALSVFGSIDRHYPSAEYILPSAYYRTKAKLYVALGEYDKAKEVGWQAIKDKAADTFCYNLTAELEIATEQRIQTQHAAELLETVTYGDAEVHPDGYTHTLLAQAYIALGKYDKAQNTLERITTEMIEQLPTADKQLRAKNFNKFLYAMAASRELRQNYASGVSISEYQRITKLSEFSGNKFYANLHMFSAGAIARMNYDWGK